MIRVNNLCFDYPSTRALDNASFSIEPHTITALVGPNGAGKTTLLRCLAALENPTLGSITVDSIDAERFPHEIHKIVSYLPDIFGLYNDLSVRQHLLFFAMSHRCEPTTIDEKITQVVHALDLTNYIDKPASELSRGLRQRLAIAQTIIHDPKILLLDEPASGLDPEARIQLSKLLVDLKVKGMTLIVSSHILSELEDYSTHMLIINQGKIINHCHLTQEKESIQDIYLNAIKKTSE